MKRLLILFFLPFILLSACGQAAPLPAATTSAPTLPSSRTLTPTYTIIPSTTFTRSPTLTPTLTPTFIPTITLDQTEAVQATGMAAYQTKIAPFGDTCPEVVNPYNMSPDYVWKFCDGYFVLSVINQNGTEWIFSYKDYLGEEFSVFMNLIHWSKDGRYLYFAPMVGYDAVEPLPYNGIALLRMDLDTGNVTTLLPVEPNGINPPNFYTLSISPTDRRLAYMKSSIYDPTIIKILDLETGEQKTLKLDPLFSDVGWFSWSEDGMELTFQVYDTAARKSYYLTYDVALLALIKSESFIPDWGAEMTQTSEALTQTPTP